MIDIELIRNHQEVVKENIKKKFQDQKLPLVDEVYELDKKFRAAKTEGDQLRGDRNRISKEIGVFMRQKEFDKAEAAKQSVKDIDQRITDLEAEEKEMEVEIRKRMMVIPNIIDPTVPIGKDDSENVEIEKYGEPLIPDYEIPYHADIFQSFDGFDSESAGRTSGNGFYYLQGDVARLHSSIISYARDFMIDHGFTYVIPPFMIHSNVVTGVMSFDEMENMMYKIDGEDLYLIGTSEHSMIGMNNFGKIQLISFAVWKFRFVL